MLGRGKCPDPYNSTHYHRLRPQAKTRHSLPAAVQFQPTAGGMQGEDTNLWLDKPQLIVKLQQAEKLLTAQSDLIDGLRAQLGDIQQHGLPAQELQHQQLELMPDASLAAMQQQKTAELLASAAEYVQHMGQTVQPLRCISEDSLAAVQQHRMVDMIREITQYLRENLKVMKQSCKALMAMQGQHAVLQTSHATGSKAGSPF